MIQRKYLTLFYVLEISLQIVSKVLRSHAFKWMKTVFVTVVVWMLVGYILRKSIDSATQASSAVKAIVLQRKSNLLNIVSYRVCGRCSFALVSEERLTRAALA